MPKLKAGDDARSQLARHRGLLALANKRLKVAGDCSTMVRKEYAR